MPGSSATLPNVSDVKSEQPNKEVKKRPTQAEKVSGKKIKAASPVSQGAEKSASVEPLQKQRSPTAQISSANPSESHKAQQAQQRRNAKGISPNSSLKSSEGLKGTEAQRTSIRGSSSNQQSQEFVRNQRSVPVPAESRQQNIYQSNARMSDIEQPYSNANTFYNPSKDDFDLHSQQQKQYQRQRQIQQDSNATQIKLSFSPQNPSGFVVKTEYPQETYSPPFAPQYGFAQPSMQPIPQARGSNQSQVQQQFSSQSSVLPQQNNFSYLQQQQQPVSSSSPLQVQMQELLPHQQRQDTLQSPIQSQQQVQPLQQQNSFFPSMQQQSQPQPPQQQEVNNIQYIKHETAAVSSPAASSALAGDFDELKNVKQKSPILKRKNYVNSE